MSNYLKVAMLIFPGTNCEQDLKKILSEHYKTKVTFIAHNESFSDHYDLYLIPGGFSYGDYLRSGSLAKMSLSISSLNEVIKKGKIVLGICNGFQILTEAHFLPGVLLKNQNSRHICKWVALEDGGSSRLGKRLDPHFALPVSHSEGNFFCSQDDLDAMLQNGQILIKYKKNPNGSLENIAGVMNPNKNVFGLMPHPERAFRISSDIPLSKHQYGKAFFDRIFSIVQC